MATDSIVAGLFSTPEQYQQQQLMLQRAMNEKTAQLSPIEQASAGLRTAGYQLGQGVGGLMGVQDPEMQLVTARNSILKGVDQTSAQSLAQAAQQLSSLGDIQGASALAQQAVAIQSKIDEKRNAQALQLQIAQEKNQTSKEIAADRNAIMAQIAQMNAALKGSTNDLQRQLLEQKIEDLKLKAEEKQATLQSQAQGKVAAFDSAIETLDVLAKHPGKKDVVGALSGGLISMVPGTNAAGFASQLETFKAQTFIPQVAALKGMGALSNAEGQKLTAAVGALDPKMKQSEFDSQISKIKTELEAAKQRAMKLPGMPKQAETPASGTVKKWSEL